MSNALHLTMFTTPPTPYDICYNNVFSFVY